MESWNGLNGKDLTAHPIPPSHGQGPSTIPGHSKPCPIQPWTFPGVWNSQPLWAKRWSSFGEHKHTKNERGINFPSFWVPRNSLGTHRAGSPVVPLGPVEVDGEIIQGPGEGEVHGGVVGRVALQRQVLAHVDVGARWCQRDLGGICRERARSLSWDIPVSRSKPSLPAPHPAPTAGAPQEEEGLRNGNAFLKHRLLGQAEALLLLLKSL